MTEIDHLLHHRIADPFQMLVIDAGTDVHVHADQLQVVAADLLHRLRQVGIPDTVLAVLAAGVGFLAMAVAKSGLMRSHTGCPAETWPS